MPQYARGFKPARWSLTPGMVDPAWQWAWRDLEVCIPMWEGGLPANGTGISELVTRKFAAVLNDPITTSSTNHQGSIATVRGLGVANNTAQNNKKSWFNFTGMSEKYQTLTDSLTMFAVVVPQSGANQINPQRIVYYTGLPGDAGSFLGRGPGDDSFQFRVDTGTSTTSSAGANSAVNGLLTTIAGVYAGNAVNNNLRIYVNGTSRARADKTGNLNQGADPDEIWLGDKPPSPNTNATFRGEILVVYVWSRVLQDGDIFRLHTDPFGPLRPRRLRVVTPAAPAAPFQPFYPKEDNTLLRM